MPQSLLIFEKPWLHVARAALVFALAISNQRTLQVNPIALKLQG